MLFSGEEDDSEVDTDKKVGNETYSEKKFGGDGKHEEKEKMQRKESPSKNHKYTPQ